jgi:hypothetical protein
VAIDMHAHTGDGITVAGASILLVACSGELFSVQSDYWFVAICKHVCGERLCSQVVTVCGHAFCEECQVRTASPLN